MGCCHTLMFARNSRISLPLTLLFLCHLPYSHPLTGQLTCHNSPNILSFINSTILLILLILLIPPVLRPLCLSGQWTCRDSLGVESPNAQWAEWLITAPLLGESQGYQLSQLYQLPLIPTLNTRFNASSNRTMLIVTLEIVRCIEL